MENGLANARVLVVGGAGFVGSNLVRFLLGESVLEVTVADNLLSSDLENLPKDHRLRFIQGSIADDSILEAVGLNYDYVWHLACFHGNQSSIFNPIADHENNLLTSLKLFNHLAASTSLKKIVYSAAGCAVAEKTFADASATSEDASVSLKHDSPYSISKLVGEMYGNYFYAQNGLPFVTARFQNVYGPGEVLGAGQWRGTPATVWRNVTPTFMWKALHGDELPLENEGVATRDFIFVDDICRGLIACALNGRSGEAYNLASGVETSIRDLAEKIVRISESSSQIRLMPARTWDNSGKRFGSTEKSRLELGFEARTSIDEGLRALHNWTVENMSRINQSIAKHADKLSHF